VLARPLAVQLYAFRDALPRDSAGVIGRIAELGLVGVEAVSALGSPDVAPDAFTLKPLLDENGLTVCAAHVVLTERSNASLLFDEQEYLGNDLLIVSGGREDFVTLDAIARFAERLNEAASLAAARDMRVGYHNHSWEWDTTIGGQSGYELLWDHVDPAIFAEVDIYWAQVAGRDPVEVIARLGPRAQLAHVKDGPAVLGEPMTAVGRGEVDVAAALTAGEHFDWHVIELDDCATDVFEAVSESVRWLVDHGFSSRQPRTTG
jgi:sugar phosphate isomerase/epimerase